MAMPWFSDVEADEGAEGVDTINGKRIIKVLGLGGSPSSITRTTEKLMEAFLEGMKDAGAEVTSYQLRDLRMKPCDGCLNCIYKTPQHCKYNDDFAKLVLPAMKESDITVMASPVYSGQCFCE